MTEPRHSSDYEIVIHMREPSATARIPLPGLSAHLADADREAIEYQIEEARSVEAPVMSIRTPSGHPDVPLAIDPRLVTEIDLIELPADEVTS
jgi:hypothetical protein